VIGPAEPDTDCKADPTDTISAVTVTWVMVKRAYTCSVTSAVIRTVAYAETGAVGDNAKSRASMADVMAGHDQSSTATIGACVNIVERKAVRCANDKLN
jgi:hypothetical protein